MHIFLLLSPILRLVDGGNTRFPERFAHHLLSGRFRASVDTRCNKPASEALFGARQAYFEVFLHGNALCLGEKIGGKSPLLPLFRFKNHADSGI